MSQVFLASFALTVFGYGLGARRDEVLSLFRRPRLLVVSMLAMFVVMPAVALALGVYLDFPEPAQVALLVLALSPVPQLLPRTTIASGGRAAYAYGLAFAVAVLSPVIVPALAHLLGRVTGRDYTVPAGTLGAVLVASVLVPLGLGLLVQRLWPGLARRIQEPLVKLANLTLLVALVLLLVTVFPFLLELASLGTLIAMAVFVCAGLAVGHAMAGPEPDQAVVLAIACATRNPGIAIGMGTANYAAESFGATIILYAVFAGIVAKPYVNWHKRRLANAPTGSQPSRTEGSPA
jgi:BASS family bile acid:Na+ symporter